jgi:hypothetical protein
LPMLASFAVAVPMCNTSCGDIDAIKIPFATLSNKL